MFRRLGAHIHRYTQQRGLARKPIPPTPTPSFGGRPCHRPLPLLWGNLRVAQRVCVGGGRGGLFVRVWGHFRTRRFIPRVLRKTRVRGAEPPLHIHDKWGKTGGERRAPVHRGQHRFPKAPRPSREGSPSTGHSHQPRRGRAPHPLLTPLRPNTGARAMRTVDTPTHSCSIQYSTIQTVGAHTLSLL